MKRRIITLILSVVLAFTFVGCGSSDSKKGSKSGSANSSLEDKFVGRWVESYLNNSDDESFEQYDAVTLNPYGQETYIELYSSGTGVTNYFVGDYYNDSGIVFEWEVAYDDVRDKELLFIYYTIEEDECDEFGFKTYRTWPDDLNFKNAKIEEEEVERDVREKYESPVETIAFRFFDDYLPFVKVEGFTDNPDLGCKNAFKSIESYRKDPEVYNAQFEEE